MCTPQLAIGMQGAGAASSALGAYYGATSQQRSLRGIAAIDEINAGVAERSAQSAEAAGMASEQRIRLNTAQLKSSQITSLAANGVDVGVGSAARVLTSTDVLGDIDANTARANGVRSAWGYRTQATNDRNDALMRRANADTISPWLNTGTSLLGSGATVASSWYRMNQSGAGLPGG